MDRKVFPSEAARMIGCSSQRVRQLVDAGRLPAERVGAGRARLIDAAAVRQLVEERKRRQRVGDGR